MLHLLFALVLLLLGACQGRSAENATQPVTGNLTPKTYQDRQGQAMPYRLLVPAQYDPQKKYPLVLYLHGSGGIGRDNLKQIQGGNSFMVSFLTSHETQAKYPCFVLVPQSNDDGWVGEDTTTPTDQLRLVVELIEQLQQTYSIDPGRRYVTGQSLGGFGTFAIISLRPDWFAAAVPLCGGGDEAKAGQIARVPLWAFHGEKDDSVKVERSRQMIAALEQAGGQPKYTEYRGEGHDVWKKVVKEPELLPWLFAQKRAQ